MNDELLQIIKAETGLSMRHNNDFLTLSSAIYRKTKERVSPTTLKRMWGYVSDQKSQPRNSTLDILARFLGYDDFYAFNKYGGVKPISR